VSFDLIVFDLDGTLVDSKRDIAESANQTLVDCGAAPLPEDAIGRMVGDGAPVLVARAFAAAGSPKPADALEIGALGVEPLAGCCLRGERLRPRYEASGLGIRPSHLPSPRWLNPPHGPPGTTRRSHVSSPHAILPTSRAR